MKTIRQLFRAYGFYETNFGFVHALKDKLSTTIRIIIPKAKRDKCISAMDEYLREDIMTMEAKNIMGKCKVPFIGYYQSLQGYRCKEVNKGVPRESDLRQSSKMYNNNAVLSSW